MLNSIFSVGLQWLAAAIPVSIAGISLLFFPLLSLWILGAHWSFRRWPPAWGPIEKCFVLYMGLSLLSALFGVNRLHSLHSIWKKDFYFFVYALFFAFVQRRVDGERLMTIFWISSIVAALLGLLQFGLGIFIHFYPQGAVAHFLANGPAGVVKLLNLMNGRAAGPRSHPIRYSEGLLFALTLSMAFLGIAKGEERWKWVVGGWLLMGAILVSQTRGTWLAFGVVMVLALWFDRKQLNKSHGLLLLIPLLALLGMAGLRTRFETIWSKNLESNTERLRMWHAGWDVFKEYPILGVGPGNIHVMVESYEQGDERMNGGWSHLHNIYINFAAERGALGLLAFMLMMLAFARPLWAVLQSPMTDPRLRAYCLSAFLGGIGFLLCGLTEMDYNNGDVLVTFYFVMGVTLALLHASQSQPDA